MFLRESIAANSHEGKFLFRLGQYTRTPALDAVVVGIRRIVLDEDVAARNPAVEDANENAVAAVRDVVAIPVVVVGPGLDQHAGRITRVNLALGTVDAKTVGEIVAQEAITA